MATTLVFLALLIGGVAPSAAQDRWQAQLNSGKYLYDLQLVKLQGTRLVVRQAHKTVSLPVREITQLELVQPTMQRNQAFGGAHDVVYQFALLTLDERLAQLREILRTHPPSNAPTR
ncbi:MAG TPA: hypothetical protein VEU73_09555 [Gemmatimonadales bacterium]|nr:hypothetical protein [Gemmatimonadales bacterium]